MCTLHSHILTFQMQCTLLYNLFLSCISSPHSQHMSACNWIDLISHWLLTADGNLCMAWFEINTLQFISQFYLYMCVLNICARYSISCKWLMSKIVCNLNCRDRKRSATHTEMLLMILNLRAIFTRACFFLIKWR